MKSFMCCFWFCIFIFEFPLNFAECKHNGIIWVGLCKKTLVKSKCKHDEHGVLKIYYEPKQWSNTKKLWRKTKHK